MKHFDKTAAQGECYFRKVDSIPKGLKPLALENGQLIIGHSETGHHHVIEHPNHAEVFKADDADGIEMLYAVIGKPTSVRHLRGHDTHEAIALQPGMYEIRKGREYDPYAELVRQVAD